MEFHLDDILADLDDAPVAPLPDLDTAFAILDDLLRLAHKPPVSPDAWRGIAAFSSPRFNDQVRLLARLLTTSRLHDQAKRCLEDAPDRRDALPDLFAAIAPLSSEMVLQNRFRREEVVRRFIDWCQGRIAGETEARSRARLEQLDYRTTLNEYQRAEEARRREEARRLKALEEARRRERASRGWRE